jgi:hypothetical protein
MNGSFRVAVVTIALSLPTASSSAAGLSSAAQAKLITKVEALWAHRRAVCAGGGSRDIVIDGHRRSGVSLRRSLPRLRRKEGLGRRRRRNSEAQNLSAGS